jgi:nicotinamide-nucleotide amidase
MKGESGKAKGESRKDKEKPVMNTLKELMLGEPPLTLAAAESMTSGRIQARIGAISGASDFFFGGITAYSLAQKVRHLGVSRDLAEPVDCVSAAVAEQMALGACALFGSDIGVATTGYAEPSAKWSVTAPFAWWAVAVRPGVGPGQARSGRVDFPGASRTEAQERVADVALAALLAWLREIRARQSENR